MRPGSAAIAVLCMMVVPSVVTAVLAADSEKPGNSPNRSRLPAAKATASSRSASGTGANTETTIAPTAATLDANPRQSASADTVADTVSVTAEAADVEPESSSWPQFRGPLGQGHTVATHLPTKWSERLNVTWKTEIPGSGWSSPVIQNGRIWLTTAENDGSLLKVVAVNQASGAIEKQVKVFEVPAPGKIHAKNNHASPSPVLHEDRLYVHFGAHGTACLALDGSILWQQKLDYYHHHGPAASPVIAGDYMVIPCDGFESSFYNPGTILDVRDFQFLAALNLADGKIGWKKQRDGRHSYATPLLIDVDGEPQLISPGGSRTSAYHPETGEELWFVRYEGYSLIPRPVYGNGLVFLCTGYDQPSLLAVRPNGKGDVTETHVEWKLTQGVPFTPSPILVDDYLYLVNDGGIATCLDAATGKVMWKRRLGGNFSASPLFGDGKLYFQDEDGATHVLVPGKQYKRLAINQLKGMTYATPAVSGQSLYLRSDKALYRIEDKPRVTPAADKTGKSTKPSKSAKPSKSSSTTKSSAPINRKS